MAGSLSVGWIVALPSLLARASTIIPDENLNVPDIAVAGGFVPGLFVVLT
jgi:hypothetical protein